MRALPAKSGFGGKLGNVLDGMLEALRSLRPAAAPGTIYQHTSKGTARTVQGRGNPAGAPVEVLTVTAEADDFLTCQTAAGATVYALKPHELQASRWNPGWVNNSRPVGHVWNLGGTAGALEYFETFAYISENLRWRILIPDSNASTTWEVPDLLTEGFPTFNVEGIVAREVLFPSYGRVAYGSQGGKTATPVQVDNRIFAIKCKDALATTPTGALIQYLDLNTCGRRWMDEKELDGSIAGTGTTGSTGDTIPLRKRQRTAILLDPT